MIAATGENGVVGVAPDVGILVLKVIEKNGVGSYKNLVAALNYCRSWRSNKGLGVSVVNISIGGSKDNKTLKKAVNDALNKGIILVAAAGNNGDNQEDTNEFSYPAMYKGVIQVGAVDSALNIGHFSNSNDEVDFLAPGINILSTFLLNNYVEMSGTSMAAPHVSGAIALLSNLYGGQPSKEKSKAIYKNLATHARTLDKASTLEGNGLIQLSLKVWWGYLN